MRTTGNVSWRTVGAGAAVVLGAACADQPSAPDLGEPLPPTAGARAFVTRVRVIEPDELNVANPAGLAFSPKADMLLVVTRALGAPAGSVTDIELTTLAADRAGTVRIATGVADPVTMAFDSKANRLLILQSPGKQLIEIRAGADGKLDPRSLRRIDARPFGVQEPRGLTVDPASGRLFILDAAGPRIIRVEPDARLDLEAPLVSAIDLAPTRLTNLRGLAFDPTTGDLHVLDPRAQALHEVTETGRLVATRDLAEFALRNPRGMTFALSGDATDDPSETSLYIAESGASGGAAGQITELSLVQPAALAAAAVTATATGTLVRTIQTSQFSPPSPDPSGITYATHSGNLVIVDGEVDEMSIYAGANVFEARVTGSLARSWTTTSFSREPVGAAYNPATRHLYISDDNGKEVYEVNPGADGLYGTADDSRRSFDTAKYGDNDPEGIAYDPAQGVLFVADGVNSEVYRVSPGANGVFDGTDDLVTSFDTEGLGLTDPEGIAYDSDFGHLYIVGDPIRLVFHVTATGTLVRTIDIAAASPRFPAGLEYAPSSQNPSVKSLWIVDRGVDNNSDPNENDGKLYEFAIPPLSGNSAPTVTITAPANGATFTQGAAITFTGTASDAQDGNLTAGLAWTSSLDGAIGSGGSFSTSSLSVGTHTITAKVTDSGGSEGSAAITVTVNPEGSGTLEVRVAASSDDAEESASGAVSLGSSDLELVFDGSDQTVGVRFNAVTIPRGATITNAYVQFQVDEANSIATSLTIRGQAADNAATFSTATGNVSSRSRTASAVAWAPPAWTTVGQAGPNQRTPNIVAIVQEIVNRPGWASGNALALIITGTGERTAVAYNGVPSAAALLHVDYSTGSTTNTAPAASNVTITGTPQVGQVLTGTYTYSDADGDAEGASTYRWLRNGAAISGATAKTYTLVSDDQGALIVFEVTPVAATGTSPGAAVQSAAVGPVAAADGVSTLAVRVAAGTDDAEESASGAVSLGSSDLELVFDRSDQAVGMRFNGVTIPPGATISSAYVQFQVDEKGSTATSLTIRGQAADNATTFSTATGNVSSRARTTSAVAWSPPAWTTIGQAGAGQRTPNLAPIVQEIVNRPGWASGNSLVLIITGTGERTAEAYNGVPSAAPLLQVEYSVGTSTAALGAR